MGLYLVNYATKDYASKQALNSLSAKIFGGFDKIWSFGPEDIDNVFREKNLEILAHKKGAGLWLWKPYFFNRVLRHELSNGDYLVHCDSSSVFMRSFRRLVQAMEESGQDIMAFELPLAEKSWTLPHVLDYFNADEDLRNSNQVMANFLMVKKTDKTVRFVSEWLDFCSNGYLMTENPKQHNLPPYFKAHRFDQSVLSVLCKKRGINPFRDPSQYGLFPEMYRNHGALQNPSYLVSPYKTTILLLRKSRFLLEYAKYIIKKSMIRFVPSLYSRIIK